MKSHLSDVEAGRKVFRAEGYRGETGISEAQRIYEIQDDDEFEREYDRQNGDNQDWMPK